MDPHAPYSPPARFQPAGVPPERIGRRFADLEEIRLGRLRTTPEEDAWIRGLYEGEVSYVDEAFGRLIDMLRELRIYDEALIIVTSDHGEEFLDHGGVEHGHTLYNELLQVPLLIKLPEGGDRRIVSDFVSTQRIAVTVLEACGVGVGEDPVTVGGTSLLAANSSPVAGVYSTAVLYHEPKESIILDGYKLIREIESSAHELYDLENDRHEQHDIAGEQPLVAARARSALEAHSKWSEQLRDSLGSSDKGRFEPDAELIKRLRALGYF
jgi:arylsulfatase A-like enzyme